MIHELEISGEVYQFNFGMGFLRDINKLAMKKIEGVTGEITSQEIGLQLRIAGLMDGDVEALADVLYRANANQKPRLTKAAIDAFIEDEETDIDAVFTQVLDFLEKSNATRKTVADVKKMAEAAKA